MGYVKEHGRRKTVEIFRYCVKERQKSFSGFSFDGVWKGF